MLFYALLKPPVQLALRVFFRRLQIRNAERLQEPGPLLIAANHPNTLMDPLVVAANRRQQIHFLAKSTFFQNPVSRWFFERSNCIPVYRRQDVESGDANITPEQLQALNEKAFGRSYDHLGRGGTLMIFPEGTSIAERRLRPLKTGAARIALGAEARHQFKLGLRILPIGINYSASTRFRSDVLLNPAAPIVVADYAAQYRLDPEAAAEALTEELRRRLEQHLVVTRDDAEDALVRQIEATFGQYLVPEHNEGSPYEEFQLTRTLLQAVAWFERHSPDHLQELRRRVTDYTQELHRLRISDEALQRSGARRGRLKRGLLTALKVVLGFPVYAYGALNNYVPYIIPSVIAKRATQDVEFIAPIMLVTGMLTFGLMYPLQTWLVHRLTDNNWLTALYALSLPVTGFYALHYWNRLTQRLQRLRLLRLFREQRPVAEGVLRQRTTILRLLADARDAYVAARREASPRGLSEEKDGAAAAL
ncbi:lysophospholipid acyltransferase family protein [Hymenobacter latericus]|uniref:lysophospholipid acyltransferase family protein n=1 Tax=Hymenobacter sp. YIM 151858-1 TaxID=2987688 RepID=UPI0022276A09|nr:lysophospholipid acyltransferase family protein [Hymenobacter sp. YIM 151858-1]UYZ58309.1 lysophospholipid acyltransferase family protein [Hymenobacter sp. YIM 151858-1]